VREFLKDEEELEEQKEEVNEVASDDLSLEDLVSPLLET